MGVEDTFRVGIAQYRPCCHRLDLRFQSCVFGPTVAANVAVCGTSDLANSNITRPFRWTVTDCLPDTGLRSADDPDSNPATTRLD
jgi:hypothetical protein